MVKMHKPTLIVLLETKMADHKKLTEELQYDMHIQFPAVGHSGSIVITWKESSLRVDEVVVTPQGTLAMVKILPSNPLGYFQQFILVIFLRLEKPSRIT